MGNGHTQPVEQGTLHLAGPAEARLRFSGPPKRLTGTIPLINKGSEKQRIRSIVVHSKKLLSAQRAPLSEIPVAARLQGGEQSSVRATLVLDPQTSPGSYDFEFVLADRKVAATAHVSAVVDLRVDPAEITILAGSSAPETRTIVLENAGNVPLALGSESETSLFDSSNLITTFLSGLHKAERESAEKMTEAFLNEWAELKAGTLVVRHEAITLAPGERKEIELECKIPTELKALHRYRARLPLYNASLSLNIYMTAKSGPGTGKTKHSGGSRR